MRVYKYWASSRKQTADNYDFLLWRGSNISLEDAQRVADEAVESLARAPRSQSTSNHVGQQYTYHTRFIPEELISSFPAADGSMLAAVTRNRYGALILNTADMMFIDADITFPSRQTTKSNSKANSGLFGWIFGGKSPEEIEAEHQQAVQQSVDSRLDQIREIARRYSRHSFRIYRTHSGFRIVLLDQRIAPDDRLATKLLDQFESDLNYKNLCRIQQSYRARLTPKPRNIQMDYPPYTYSHHEKQGAAYEAWEQEYERKSLNYRVCEFVEEIGNNGIDPDIAFLLDLHDEASRVSTGLPLA